jgi:hypothetical protein
MKRPTYTPKTYMRIYDSGMTPRICRLVICRLKRKICGHL